MSFAQLPNGRDMPLWDGEMSSIPELLRERTKMAANSFEAGAPAILWATFGKSQPVINTFAQQLKSQAAAIVLAEQGAQGTFEAEVVTEYERRLAMLRGGPGIADFNRPRGEVELNKLFGGSGIEGLPE